MIGFAFPKDVIYVSRMISRDVHTSMDGARLVLSKDIHEQFDWHIETVLAQSFVTHRYTLGNVGLMVPVRLVAEDDHHLVFDTIRFDPIDHMHLS